MITDPIPQLLRRVEELEPGLRCTVYQGVVTDVDASKRIVRVDDGVPPTTPIRTRHTGSTGSSSRAFLSWEHDTPSVVSQKGGDQ